MRRSLTALMVVAGLLVAACANTAAPTPQIVYLTPQPTVAASPMAGPTPKPTPVPIPKPTAKPTPIPPTPRPAGVKVDLTFSGPHIKKHLTGFFPQTTGTRCTWQSSPSDSTVQFVDSAWLDGSDAGVANLNWFHFEDLDGPGRNSGQAILDVVSGFDTYTYIWSPGDAFEEFTKGTATYKNNYTTIAINVSAYDALSGDKKYTSVKGTMTCSR